MMDLWGLLISAAWLAFSLHSGSAAATTVTTLFPATDARIRFTGRSVVEKSTRLFDWSSSYIEANVVGPLDCKTSSVAVAPDPFAGTPFDMFLTGSLLLGFMQSLLRRAGRTATSTSYRSMALRYRSS